MVIGKDFGVLEELYYYCDIYLIWVNFESISLLVLVYSNLKCLIMMNAEDMQVNISSSSMLYIQSKVLPHWGSKGGCYTGQIESYMA